VAEHLVFARRTFEEPLTQQGAVEADDADDARERARERYGDGWVELTLIPADDITWVLPARPALRPTLGPAGAGPPT
jgi:hypothetical protein